MTNFEKIKNMSVEELARIINSCEYCAYDNCGWLPCEQGITKYLNQEVDE